jgi:uncharacterized protein YhbP (UPF0306 family)
MDELLREKILRFLAQHNVMTLATIRPDGFPQTTLVYFVHSELILHFATDPCSQKASNIYLNNRVTAAIAGQTERAYKLQAFYLSGTAKKIVDPPVARYLQLELFRAVPQAKRFAPADPRQLEVYSITPVAMTLVDFEVGYGHTVHVEF